MKFLVVYVALWKICKEMRARSVCVDVVSGEDVCGFKVVLADGCVTESWMPPGLMYCSARRFLWQVLRFMRVRGAFRSKRSNVRLSVFGCEDARANRTPVLPADIQDPAQSHTRHSNSASKRDGIKQERSSPRSGTGSTIEFEAPVRSGRAYSFDCPRAGEPIAGRLRAKYSSLLY